MCGPNGQALVHCTFLGTAKRCSDPDNCTESLIWVFYPILGGLCLQCVHQQYPEYFGRTMEANPETYTSILKHESLPIDSTHKRRMLIYDLVSQLYIAEIVNEYISTGGQTKHQTIFDTHCHTILDTQGFEAQPFLSKDDIMDQYITGSISTEETMERARWAYMERWMAIFLRNLDQMDKAFELLKDWRFGPPADDLFEKKFKVTKMLDLKFLQGDDLKISSCVGAVQKMEIGHDGNNQK
jgi:hypothetical protein